MTQDGHEPDPNDAPPPPPTSTHWAEPAVDDDAGILPPFVPGRSRADHDDEPAEEEPISFHDWPAGFAAGEPPEMDVEVSQAPASKEDRPMESPGSLLDDDPEAALASRLEELAHRIRTEGRTGIESEMASLDRFTALVAGVVAGYLAGLGD